MPESAAALCSQAGAAVSAASSLFPLEVRSLGYVVNGRRLLDDLSFQIGPGKVTVVMGPNGAGKSLLLRLLHGLIEPTSGHIYWGGRPLTSDLRRRQAMVFQRPVLLRRSVVANVAFALKSRGTASAERGMELLEHVGLEAHAN
ncbi:MAG: ATP-binding cassette domain-containing protein, partial [Chromatiaceae bacterium]